MRKDRGPKQLRKVSINKNILSHNPASVLISVGNTMVLCAATYEERVPSFLKGRGSGWLRAEYGLLPQSTVVRTEREVIKGRQTGRTLEIQRMIGRSLRQAINLDNLGEITIVVDCDVIQADGGTRCAAITGGFVAVGELFKILGEAGKISILPLKNFIAAVSVGKVEGEILLDLSYEEDVKAEVDMNLVMTQDGRIVEIQATVEGKEPLTQGELLSMIELGGVGISQLIDIQKDALPDYRYYQ